MCRLKSSVQESAHRQSHPGQLLLAFESRCQPLLGQPLSAFAWTAIVSLCLGSRCQPLLGQPLSASQQHLWPSYFQDFDHEVSLCCCIILDFILLIAERRSRFACHTTTKAAVSQPSNSSVGDASYLQVYQTARRGLVLFQHAHYRMLDSLQ